LKFFSEFVELVCSVLMWEFTACLQSKIGSGDGDTEAWRMGPVTYHPVWLSGMSKLQWYDPQNNGMLAINLSVVTRPCAFLTAVTHIYDSVHLPKLNIHSILW